MDGFWESGLSGEEIYRNFTEASGGGELAAAAEIVRSVQAEHEDEAATVRALAVRMESAWQGDAAGAAQRGAVPLAAEHEWGAPQFFTAQDLTSRQLGSFGDARNGVVPVPPAPDKPGGWAIITSPTTLPTYERQLAEHNAAAQHNVDVMTGYEDASSFNGDNLPTSYGSITPDSAGIAVQPDKGPDGGDRNDDGRPAGGSEWKPTGGSSGGPDPTASSSGGPGGQPTQETTPGGYVPPKPLPGPGPGVPGTGVPSGSGGGGGFVGVPPVGILPGGPGPGTRGPVGGPGGSDGGSGGRGGVPGGGRPGAGPGGGEAGHGQRGGSPGVGPPAGARGGAGGVPMGVGASRGRGGEDEERERPSWLVEPGDPEDTFGTDERTAPPVIGDQDEDKD